MSTFTSHYLQCVGRELHFTEWGRGHAQTVIAWHGLARTGRDMDAIAAHLSQHFRVICPDTIGRGLSQWSPDPAAEYNLAFYVRLALWLRYTGPDTTLSFEIMIDILLIVVIGAVLFVLAQNYLQDLLKLGATAFDGVPVLGAVLTPDRWLLWLGVLFVLSVYHFPSGIVGRLRALVTTRRP